MKISEILTIYDTIKDDSHPNLSIGGYPALVMQRIIPHERETKDVDLCDFSSSKYPTPDLDMGIRSLSYTNSRKLRAVDLSQRFAISPVKSIRAISGATAGEGDNAKHFNEQNKNLLELGINSSYSVLISLDNNVPEREWSIERVPQYLNSPRYISGLDPFELSSPTIASYNTLSSVTKDRNTRWIELCSDQSFNNVGTLDEAVSELLSEMLTIESLPLAEMADLVERHAALSVTRETLLARIAKINTETNDIVKRFVMNNVCRNYVKTLDIIAKNKCISIDLFNLDWDKRDKFSVVIDGRRYVHYYLILKAKYAYCLNPFTDQIGFDKHINDLKNSFNEKRIEGVNYPKDIDHLIKLREDAKK